MNHKSSWAEENRSPAMNNDSGPRRILVNPSIGSQNTSAFSNDDILIVASKLKQYIKDKHDMSTSANVMEVLSHIVRRHTDDAVEKARSEGRKTVMDRDF